MIAQPASSESYRLRTDSLWWLFYWTLLALVFAGAIWQRFRLPLDPIADPDTWGYLSPALRKLTGAEFGHTNGRNFIYPGFVLLVLRLFADFRAITIAQHFLGLLAGAVFLLTWKRARIFVANPRIGHVAHDLLGLVGAAIFLLQWQTIVFEKEIRPEGICAFVVSITFYLLIQFLACFFLEYRRTATVAYAIALAFTAIFLAYQTEFWSRFAFCIVANHCLVLAEWLVVAKGLVGSSLAPPSFCCRNTFSVAMMK